MLPNPASSFGIFLHVATMGRYQLVLDEVFAALVSSGTLGDCTFVEISVVGTGDVALALEDPKFRLVRRSADVRDFEHPTLSAIRDHCIAHPDARVLYLNCLGGRHVGWEWELRCEWRRLLYYLFLDHRARCLAALATRDVCVVQWARYPLPHASSNNWWANAEYIASLVDPNEAFDRIRDIDLSRFGGRWEDPAIKRRHSGEFWLGLRATVKPFDALRLEASGFPRSEYRSVPWWHLADVDWVKVAQRQIGERAFGWFDVAMGWRAIGLQCRYHYGRIKGRLLRTFVRTSPAATEHRQ